MHLSQYSENGRRHNVLFTQRRVEKTNKLCKERGLIAIYTMRKKDHNFFFILLNVHRVTFYEIDIGLIKSVLKQNVIIYFMMTMIYNTIFFLDLAFKWRLQKSFYKPQYFP